MKIILVFRVDSSWMKSKWLHVVENLCAISTGINVVYFKGDLLAYLL